MEITNNDLLPLSSQDFFSDFSNLQTKIMPLRVDLVSPEERQKMIEIMDLFRKATETEINNQTSQVSEKHLSNSIFINNCIANYLTDPTENEEIYCCKDEKNQVHGFMVLERKLDHVYIDCLYTNPNNLPNSSRRVPGAGTRLLLEAARIAVEEKTNLIKLYALDSAKPFYEKLGFKRESSFWGYLFNHYTREISFIEQLFLINSPDNDIFNIYQKSVNKTAA